MIRKGKSPRVFGLGQCCLDYIGRIQAYPPADAKVEMSDLVIQGGGPVATALVALSRWGIPGTFAGVIGDDPLGEKIKASLDEEGIDISGLRVRKGFESQFAFIAAQPGLGTRTVFWRRPTGPPLQPEEIDYRVLRESKVLHTDGLSLEASLAAAREARKSGVQVVVDSGTLREGLLELARLSDAFIVSETFAAALARDPVDACRKLGELGPRVVAVTMGSKGYVASAEGKIWQKPAYPVEAVDTTGCGDIFHAGFIYGLICGWRAERSFDLAAWSAAMASRKMGGRSGIPSLKELQDKGF